jgi:hypothetical protein
MAQWQRRVRMRNELSTLSDGDLRDIRWTSDEVEAERRTVLASMTIRPGLSDHPGLMSASFTALSGPPPIAAMLVRSSGTTRCARKRHMHRSK